MIEQYFFPDDEQPIPESGSDLSFFALVLLLLIISGLGLIVFSKTSTIATGKLTKANDLTPEKNIQSPTETEKHGKI